MNRGDRRLSRLTAAAAVCAIFIIIPFRAGPLSAGQAVLAEEVSSVAVSSASRKFTPLEKTAMFAVVEGLVWLNASAAQKTPELYGSVLVLLSPLSVTTSVNKYGAAAGIAGTVGLGVYNIVDADRDSRTGRRRFWTTFIGIHVVGVISTAVTSLTGGNTSRLKHKSEEEGAFFMAPGPDSLMLSFNHRF